MANGQENIDLMEIKSGQVEIHKALLEFEEAFKSTTHYITLTEYSETPKYRQSIAEEGKLNLEPTDIEEKIQKKVNALEQKIASILNKNFMENPAEYRKDLVHIISTFKGLQSKVEKWPKTTANLADKWLRLNNTFNQFKTNMSQLAPSQPSPRLAGAFLGSKTMRAQLMSDELVKSLENL